RQTKRQWHYADNGLLTATDDSLRGTTRYGYDPLGRLRQAVSPIHDERFAFDPAGNLVDPDDSTGKNEGTDKNENSSLATRWASGRETGQRSWVDYPNAPKLSPAMGNLLKRYAGTHYHYDAFGNLTRRIAPNGHTWHYQYNAEHRLTEASLYHQAPAAGDDAVPVTQAQYAYDG
ncbi:RHS repeat domain-containing protein, partial [Halomonas sp. V046]|uniref:RHS repeat domain-containing protein n=1 Tax=Halomonas sp. V046 TaxID=3459611 RepID=UPI004043E19E